MTSVDFNAMRAVLENEEVERALRLWTSSEFISGRFKRMAPGRQMRTCPWSRFSRFRGIMPWSG